MASICYTQPVLARDEWQPISQEELKMTSEPRALGAPAIILYRQVDRDDSTLHPKEYNYVRIKVFTEEGRRYADIAIPYEAKGEKVYNIRARTIHPDGTIVEFNGQVFEREVFKARRFKFLTKTFTLSDVQPGSIIEYQFMRDLDSFSLSTHWILSQELFTKHARFSLKRYPRVFALQWAWPNGLPEESTIPVKERDTIRLDSRNIPAFTAEEDMPPEDTIRFKVDFNYTDPELAGDPENFWKKLGMRWNTEVETFIEKRKPLEEAVAKTVSASDTPEIKLQKIYARVQQIRNTSYERETSEQEQKRAKEKEIKNVEDLWKRGRGNWVQINWTFLALLRAAGFEAYAVMIAARDKNFFNPKYQNAADLNANAVLVKLNGNELYFDPGTIFTPFGLLPWGETGVQGLKLDKEGGTWVTTPYLESSASQIKRNATVKVSEEGALEGNLTVTYSGLEAAWRRFVERDEDDAKRKKFLEDEIKASVPVTAEIELTNHPDWTSTALTLVAEFHLNVQRWASGLGRRWLLPVALFGAQEQHTCERGARIHPLYFGWKFQKVDDVLIALPKGWQVGGLPPRQGKQSNLVGYSLTVENDKDMLHVTRVLRSDVISLDSHEYSGLHDFYQAVRTGDDQQVVLQPSSASAGN